jgi:hypothetical protein
MTHLLTDLQSALPGLRDALDAHPYLNHQPTLWEALQRLLLAHGPSGGAWLPGAIVDDIEQLAASLGLRERFIRQIGATGNAGVWLGADKPINDVIVISHMDRPSFKVRGDGTLYPVCANRFPDGRYTVGAKALRFMDGRLGVSARGTLVSERSAGRDLLRFEAEAGQATTQVSWQDTLWQDTLTMDVPPTLVEGVIRGTGLDNCLGVLTMLGAAAALASAEGAIRAKGKRVLFVFTDLEEGLPEAYFGHGAARLAYAVPPPTYGCLIADAHTAGADGPALGGGASHGHISAWGRGSFVAPNYLALAVGLAAQANTQRPGTVQLNTGYLSRSDDMALGRWTQILGMIGAPMIDAHTGHESGRLADVPPAIWWLAHFTGAVLGMSEAISTLYLPTRPAF